MHIKGRRGTGCVDTEIGSHCRKFPVRMCNVARLYVWNMRAAPGKKTENKEKRNGNGECQTITGQLSQANKQDRSGVYDNVQHGGKGNKPTEDGDLGQAKTT
ncbi:hypothetical protein BaRGS_00035390 [Batillaria attramentaria]|uniref:Uncharacterized protein n=1 Tax=Batillaria attramentaria TaxID=370345 RepID=A0ABD0JG58_9CAEN